VIVLEQIRYTGEITENVIFPVFCVIRTSIVARYVISLATAFNKFYHDCSILQADEKGKMARLFLVDIVQKVLCEACGLLGMECPEEI